jgi:hypothetical protein
LEDQIQRPTGELLAPIFGAVGPRSALALNPGVGKLVPKRVNQLEREIAPIDLDNDAGLVVVDDQLAVVHVITGGGISRSNWAKDKRTFSVSRPMLVEVRRASWFRPARKVRSPSLEELQPRRGRGSRLQCRYCRVLGSSQTLAFEIVLIEPGVNEGSGKIPAV